jgi:hypothetical protein
MKLFIPLLITLPFISALALPLNPQPLPPGRSIKNPLAEKREAFIQPQSRNTFQKRDASPLNEKRKPPPKIVIGS